MTPLKTFQAADKTHGYPLLGSDAVFEEIGIDRITLDSKTGE